MGTTDYSSSGIFAYLRALDSFLLLHSRSTKQCVGEKSAIHTTCEGVGRSYSYSLDMLVVGSLIYMDYSSLEMLTYLSDRTCLHYSEAQKLIQ